MDTQLDNDRTIPPVRTLKYNSASELYTHVPQVASFTKHRPDEDEDALRYLSRLSSSTTPEDAITYAAFATEPRASIGWGMQCVRSLIQEIAPDDRLLQSYVAQWLDHPGDETRWRTMQSAMFAPRRSPIVYLGLGVGWSGGPLSPNDPSMIPAWRAPYAVNRAVLTAVANAGGGSRSVSLARVLDLASGLFRVY